MALSSSSARQRASTADLAMGLDSTAQTLSVVAIQAESDCACARPAINKSHRSSNWSTKGVSDLRSEEEPRWRSMWIIQELVEKEEEAFSFVTVSK